MARAQGKDREFCINWSVATLKWHKSSCVKMQVAYRGILPPGQDQDRGTPHPPSLAGHGMDGIQRR